MAMCCIIPYIGVYINCLHRGINQRGSTARTAIYNRSIQVKPNESTLSVYGRKSKKHNTYNNAIGDM